MSPAAAGWLAGLLVLAAAALVAVAGAAARRGVLAPRLAGLGGGGPGKRAARVVVPPPRRLVAVLDAAGVRAAPGRVWSVWLLTAVAAPVTAGLAGGPGLGVTVLVVACAGPVLALGLTARRAAVRYEASVPVALDALARSLRSGGSLLQSLGEVAAAVPGPLGEDLAVVAATARRGVPLATALDAWPARRPLPVVRLAAAALALGAETGGAQARAVDGVAATARERLAVAAEVRALSSQARASAAVLVVAPVAFAAFAAATDARAAAFMARTPLGALLLAAGLCLDAAGALWMARIVRGAHW